MQDPVLDNQLLEAREMKEMWSLFHDFFKIGITGEAPSPENEARFLNVKSRIAMLHETFMSTLTAERQVGQNMMQIVARCITLRHVGRLTDVDIKKMNIEWHEAFLLLNSTIGDLEEKVERMAVINPYVYQFNKVKERVFTSVGNFLKSGGFRFVAIAGSIIIAIFAFLNLGGAEFMRDTPALAPLYDLVSDQYRNFINPQAPFRNIDRMWANSRGLPDKFEKRGQVDTLDREEVERRMNRPFDPPVFSPEPLNIGDDLKQAVDFQAVSIRYQPGSGPGAGTAQVYIFRFASAGQANLITSDFIEWRKKLTDDSANRIDNQIRVLRAVNCLVFIHGGSTIMRDRLVDDTFRWAEKTTI